MKIFEALKWGFEEINSRYYVREILKFCEKLSDEKLILNFNETMKNEDNFKRCILEFKNDTPLAYITHECEFMGLGFYVDERVLIPRCETEILVQKAIEILKDKKNAKICEIGVGSGIISILLKKNLPDAHIYATDLSQGAIEVARKNAQKFGVNINFFNCSLMDDVTGNFDLIVSNPPYIAKSYKLDESVLKEPHLALFGGEKGDELLKEIVKISKNRAKILACEIGYDQKDSMDKFLKENGFEAKFYQDLAGFDRGFVAKNLNLMDKY